MRKLIVLGVLGVGLAACNQMQPAMTTPMSQTETDETTDAQTLSTAQTVGEVEAQTSVTPVTVSGGSGNQCLVYDILAQNGAFLRAGTAGTLENGAFIVNGVKYFEPSDTEFAVKNC